MRRYRPVAGTLIILLLASGVMSAADAMSVADPFRPFPSAELTSSSIPASVATLRLSAVLISPYRHQAIINNRLITVGDHIGGVQVLQIDPRGVLVLRQGEKRWLQLVQRDIAKPEGGQP